jgi:hypothetical protein
MNPYRSTGIALTAAVTNGISVSQSLGAAGNLTITGSLATAGVAALSSTNVTARRVGITSAGNDSTLIWTITGTDRYGNVQSEALVGGNVAAVQSVNDYATVTKIRGSKATASTVTAGTTAAASSPWFTLDVYREFFLVGLYASTTGTVTYTVEITPDDPNAAQNGSIEPNSYQPPQAWALGALTAQTANGSAALSYPAFAVRITITAGTGSAGLQVLQSGTCG